MNLSITSHNLMQLILIQISIWLSVCRFAAGNPWVKPIPIRWGCEVVTIIVIGDCRVVWGGDGSVRDQIQSYIISSNVYTRLATCILVWVVQVKNICYVLEGQLPVILMTMHSGYTHDYALMLYCYDYLNIFDFWLLSDGIVRYMLYLGG